MTLLSAVAAAEETPVDRFLTEQANLTAVERFAQRHEAELVPRQARYYRDLIPLAEPEPGQQYGFEVDLDSCTGCKACVAACHSLNGLDDDESWRSVTLLSGGTPARPFQQTVTAACHHCVDPACLNGCPVDAYEKDPVTGIVSHLDDQCIGCGYCMLSCPYEVPVYNHGRGIVRKCDLCKGRLAAGEAPACVQACPNGAIAVKVVDIAAVRARAASGHVVPGAPPSAITVPTTLYITATGRVHDSRIVHPPASGPAKAHPPLAVMLVLTQLSVGAFVTDLLLRLLIDRGAGLAQTVDASMALAAGVVALGGSVFHLGRPRYFYRAVIGLRHSWLSREVVAFGAFTGLAALYAVVVWRAPTGSRTVPTLLGAAVAASGLAGVACSVLIYTTTHRSTWRPATVTSKFALTAAVCGLVTVLWASVVSAVVGERPQGAAGRSLPLLLAGVMVLKLAAEVAWMRLPHPELRATTVCRFASGLVGGVVLPILLAGIGGRPTWLAVAVATLALTGVMVGELSERSLFFTTASPPT
ncbi:MAG TPA: DmsC/YnfH family molybdoenzyme membrane anchor subunit [Acidimicrobiales bacterium]|nr:DmsC/YnfH family molybdoenzyme membrane anchor subunit [Acidimicrobiales bacterium]